MVTKNEYGNKCETKYAEKNIKCHYSNTAKQKISLMWDFKDQCHGCLIDCGVNFRLNIFIF